ncbi:MAG: hypothetical protein DRQ55_17685 [Planctomycetota bacterium]|nr:MAG: hypothetical protein DRQ55_17685 [Planctomycetota bacterium]
MRWREVDGEWTTQQAEWLSEPTDSVSSRLQSHRRVWDALYCGELLRDVGTLIPYHHGEVAAVGDSESVEQVICGALTRDRHHSRRDITAAVREFCDRCAPSVVAAGQAAFEIILSKSEENAPAPEAFNLMHVQNYRKRFGRPMQYRPGRGWTQLDGNLLVVFEMDKARRGAIRSAMESLAVASRHQNALHEMVLNRPPGYDFKAHQEREAIGISRATRTLGWSSSMFAKYARGPYQVSRHLTWYEFRLELREMAIDGLNRALRIAGAAMGFDVQLEVRDLPTRDDIAEARKRLEGGRCGRLVDLMEPFY